MQFEGDKQHPISVTNVEEWVLLYISFTELQSLLTLDNVILSCCYIQEVYEVFTSFIAGK